MTPRHHGDPAAEYAAATRPAGTPGATPAGAALFDRSDARIRLLIHGRAPARMLHGLVTGRIPTEPVASVDPPAATSDAAWMRGEVAPSLVLTPKGRILTDLRLVRLGSGEDAAFLADLPKAGFEPLAQHLTRFLPPRFARAAEVSSSLRHYVVVGPGAAEALRQVMADPEVMADPKALLETLTKAPPAALFRGSLTPEGAGPFLCVRGDATLGLPAVEILGTADLMDSLAEALRQLGVRPAGDGVWHTLRVEAGAPETGGELDAEVIPPEAGLQFSHIDHQKGCYTGQEVIVRIRDRGHVNRHLRGLLLGEQPAPPRGTPLWIEGRDREAGQILTTAASPRWGQTIALAWVRREAEPGSQVHIGTPEGPYAEVRALDGGTSAAAGTVAEAMRTEGPTWGGPLAIEPP